MLRCLSRPDRVDAVEYSGQNPNGGGKTPLSGSQPNRILILRFSALGDVIQTLPILSWLRERYPTAEIGWAIDEELVPAIEGHPELNRIHPISRNRWMREMANPLNWPRVAREYRAYIDGLKACDYDLAVDVQSLFKTSFTAFCAGIERRVGYGHNRELSGFFLNDKHFNRKQYFDPQVFHVDHLKALARAVGCARTEFDYEAPHVPPHVDARIEQMLSAFAQKRTIVACAPGTQWVSKLWPERYWTQLINMLLERTDMNVLLVGSKSDKDLCDRIEQSLRINNSGRVLNIAGQTNISEMYSLYRRVGAAVGADSAPQHIAGAVHTPCVVAMFGPTASIRTAPFGSPYTKVLSTEGSLPCQPCHKKKCPLGTTECLTRIVPEMVFEELIRGLNEMKVPVGDALCLQR